MDLDQIPVIESKPNKEVERIATNSPKSGTSLSKMKAKINKAKHIIQPKNPHNRLELNPPLFF